MIKPILLRFRKLENFCKQRWVKPHTFELEHVFGGSFKYRSNPKIGFGIPSILS